MKNMIFISIFIFNITVQAQTLPVLLSLDSLEWKNRIIVVNKTQNQDKYLYLFKEEEAKINDRDIIWFLIKNNFIHSNYNGTLSNEFIISTKKRLKNFKNKVILIGKDGGIKSESNYLNLDDIFSDVDSMPMRKLEMQKK